MEFKIRTFIEDDIDLYEEGEVDAFQLTYPGLTITAELRNALKENVIRSISSQYSEGFTAMLGKPIGFIILSTQYIHELPVGYIDNIYIKEEHRNQGYGHKLLLFAQRYCCEKGYRILQLDVSIHHKSALKLYETEGFTVASYRMEKNITP